MRLHCVLSQCCILLVVGLFGFHSSSSALALDSESPEVKLAISRAVQYLEGTSPSRIGAKALVGMTLIKAGKPKDHALIKSAIEAIEKMTANGPEGVSQPIYDVGIAIMFLASVDGYENRDTIEVLAKSLHRTQKPHGAWGYATGNHAATCDTSMTQYAVLGLWEAQDLAGVYTPPEIWNKVAYWLICTQDNSGGYGYQGLPSNGLGQHVKQSAIKQSMTAAGLGSLFITKNMLGLSDLKKKSDDDTPDALKPFESKEDRAKRVKTKIDERHFKAAGSAGDSWMKAKSKIDDVKAWHYYFLYALERYESLRMADRGVIQKNPTWYVKGATVILRQQKFDGAWESGDKGGDHQIADTCFATLFLIRSTKKTLETASMLKFKADTLVGGRGIPTQENLRIRNGRVVVKPFDGPKDKLAEILSDSKSPQYQQAVERIEDLASTANRREITSHEEILLKLIDDDQRNTRLAAVRALAAARNLDYVPLLIAAISDPDFEIMQTALKGLRAVSRKSDGFGYGLRPNTEERQAAIGKWKDWYLTIRPDAEFE